MTYDNDYDRFHFDVSSHSHWFFRIANVYIRFGWIANLVRLDLQS